MSDAILQVCNLNKSFDQEIGHSAIGKIGWQAMWRALIRNRKKRHLQSFEALSELNFTLPRGESLGIIGLNGSGKSTLLQIIAGTLEPTSGTVKINGKIAALLELGSGFNPDFTGLENIYLSATIHGLAKKEIDAKLNAITRFADIGDFLFQPLRTYSSGMGLRLAFAVAAHIDANILIIDEALAVGDARFQLKCSLYIEKFKESGGTLILVSHDLNSVAKLCDRSILLHHGKLICKDRSINVINEYSKVISENTHHLINIPERVFDNEATQKSTTDSNSEEVKTMSYGGTLGQIKNAKVNGSESALIKAGDEFTISFQITSRSEIKAPIFALRFRDTKGQEIYGTNTNFQKISTPNLRPGDSWVIQFIQKANLGVGKYLVSVGFTFYENEELKVVHRLRECIEFEIFNHNESFGLSNCFSKISIEEFKQQ